MTTAPATPGTAPRGGRVRLRVLVCTLAGAIALGGGVGFAASHKGGAGSVAPVQVAATRPIPVPVVRAVGQRAGTVPWDRPLSVTVTDGTLTSVTAVGSNDTAVDGELTDTGWTSASTLLPASTYTVTATVLDRAGKARTLAVSTRTTPPSKTLHAVLSPGDGNVVGVGMPVILTLDRAVPDAADRAAIEQRLDVTASPSVSGSWRWMSPTELHYRGPSYWAAHSTIKVRADFRALHLSGGTWGEGLRTTSYRIGSRVVSTVDVTGHVMRVVVDGTLARTVKVSTGREKYPTQGGVHLVLEKTKLKIMDSATVGIPRNSPDGYFEKVPNSVRISYSGEFVHSAGWSVKDQGIRNVSHGCVNVSPTDSAWFFDQAKRGDVVDIIHASAAPRLSDPGMSDWNIPFASWAN